MRNKAIVVTAAVLLCAGPAGAQDQPIPQGAVKVNLGESSPLSMVSSATTDSRAISRGAALELDLHMSLALRNDSPHRVHGVALRVVAQEVTLGGKGSVTYPSLNVETGGVLPVRIDMRLLRPSQAVGGPLV